VGPSTLYAQAETGPWLLGEDYFRFEVRNFTYTEGTFVSMTRPGGADHPAHPRVGERVPSRKNVPGGGVLELRFDNGRHERALSKLNLIVSMEVNELQQDCTR